MSHDCGNTAHHGYSQHFWEINIPWEIKMVKSSNYLRGWNRGVTFWTTISQQICLNITMPGIQRMSHLFEIMPLFKICDRYSGVIFGAFLACVYGWLQLWCYSLNHCHFCTTIICRPNIDQFLICLTNYVILFIGTFIYQTDFYLLKNWRSYKIQYSAEYAQYTG